MLKTTILSANFAYGTILFSSEIRYSESKKGKKMVKGIEKVKTPQMDLFALFNQSSVTVIDLKESRGEPGILFANQR